MRRTGKSGVAASLVYDYLKPLSLNNVSQEDISSLENFIASVCQKHPGDIVFMNILRDFGWNRVSKRFDHESLDLLDLLGLKMALSKKSLMMMTTRQSHMGPNISPKSYAPSILLNYLTFICASQTSQLPPIAASMSSDYQHVGSSSQSPHHGSSQAPLSLHLLHVSSRDEQDETKHSHHHSQQTHAHHPHLTPSHPAYDNSNHHDSTHGQGARPQPRNGGKLVIGDDSSLASSKPSTLIGPQSILSPTPSSLFFHGVCLLADISGFTRLSGAFCEKGKLGLDGLQQATNGYMGRLVEVIYQHGGDIIKFAGDAIICVFLDKKTRRSIAKGQCRTFPLTPYEAPLVADADGDGEPPCSYLAEEGSFYCAQVADLALQCAMELRQISTEQLTVHVAASCGEMCFGILGGYKDRWECLISGDCLMALSQCLDDAPSREVAVTPRLIHALGPQGIERFGAQLLPSGNYKLTIKPGSINSKVSTSTAGYRTSNKEYDPSGCDSPVTVVADGNSAVVGFTGASIDMSIDRGGPAEESKIAEPLLPATRNISDDAQVHAAAAAFALASRGDVGAMRSAITVSVATELEEEGEEELVDWVLQSSKPEYMRMVGSFIPLPVTLAFESGGLRYLAEIREVTTMFMKWDSYDPQLHQNLVSLQPAFYSVQSVLDEAGGFLRQFLVDDKGCVLIACWGVPTASFMNNAHRALTAAAKIHQHFLSIGMRCSIGITTGNVYCGNVGSEMRREYAAIGDVVNLSARLMSKAKGGVYIDEATYSRLSVRMWEMFDELAPMMVKGKPQPIQAYSYHTNHAAPEIHKVENGELHEIQTTCKSFLKRALESLVRPTLHKSSAKLAQMERPPLQTVLIEGRTGSGKFSTVQWLRKQAESRELRLIHIGSLDAKDALMDYKVTAKLFSLFIGTDVYNNAHSQQMVVTHLLHEVYGSNNDVIDKVALPAMRVAFNLSEPVSVGNSNDASSSQHNASNLALKRKIPTKMIADTVREIFAYFLAEQAHVVIVENLHHCDDSSLKCLAALHDVRASSLVVYTLLSSDEMKSAESLAVSKQPNDHTPISRQGMHAIGVKAVAVPASSHAVDGIEMFRNLLQHQPNVHYMVLDNYNVTEIEAMVGSALGMDQVPLGLAQWVQQLSGGSIYWIKEILQFLKSLGPEEFANVTSFHSFGSLARQSSVHSSSGTANKRFSFSEPQSQSVSSPAPLSLSQPSPGNPVASVDAIKAQLELLILCRFEKLPQDDQRILKAASIIGCSFSRYVLYGILSAALKAQLQAALKTLLKERWIMKVTDLRGVELPPNTGLVGGLDSEYIFCHPTAWETLYELTPPGDRTKMHRSIAEYYENMTADDPHLFECISAHFAHVDESRAFEYSCRAALFYLSSDEQDLQRALSLLETSCNYVSSMADLQVLLVLVGTAELVFYSDVDNIIMKRPDGSLVRGPSDVSGSKSGTGEGRKGRPPVWWAGCCGGGVVSAIKSNRVAPESSMVSRSSAVSNGSKSVRLLRTDLSHNSLNAFTQLGKERVEDRLRILDEKIQLLRQSLEKQGKQGVLQRWQRNIVEARDEEEEEEYSWRSKSYFVSARQL